MGEYLPLSRHMDPAGGVANPIEVGCMAANWSEDKREDLEEDVRCRRLVYQLPNVAGGI